MKHDYEAINLVVRDILRKQFDSDMDTLALDQKTANWTSSVPAYYHSTAIYHAVVYGMCADFVLTLPTTARNRLLERGIWTTLGCPNSQQPRTRRRIGHVRPAGDHTRRRVRHRTNRNVSLYPSE